MTEDEQYMALALAQARLGYGRTVPNPMVGAVVVRDGRIIGEGYHHQAGQPHAEPNAIRDALARYPELVRGATLYVTLEPCCTYGRTPPCTKLIIETGIARVVVGDLDVNPKHAGAGIDVLRNAGVNVTTGVLEEECRQLNQVFNWWITRRRPFVTLKMAMTLDGRIATNSGDSKWVTGPEARSLVQEMRRGAQGVMVGGNTALTDNPSLLVREPADWWRQPRRFVWSSRPLPEDLQMNQDGGPAPERVKPVTRQEWLDFLGRIGQEEVCSLLLEGGGELAAAALSAKIVNKVAFFIAPKILGGRDSRPVVGGENPMRLADALPLTNVTRQLVGEDLLVSGLLGSN